MSPHGRPSVFLHSGAGPFHVRGCSRLLCGPGARSPRVSSGIIQRVRFWPGFASGFPASVATVSRANLRGRACGSAAGELAARTSCGLWALGRSGRKSPHFVRRRGAPRASAANLQHMPHCPSTFCAGGRGGRRHPGFAGALVPRAAEAHPARGGACNLGRLIPRVAREAERMRAVAVKARRRLRARGFVAPGGDLLQGWLSEGVLAPGRLLLVDAPRCDQPPHLALWPDTLRRAAEAPHRDSLLVVQSVRADAFADALVQRADQHLHGQ